MHQHQEEQLFGAPLGDCYRSEIIVDREERTLEWHVKLRVYTVMRKDPMTLWVLLNDDQGIDAIVGSFTAIVLKTYYCGGETIRMRMNSLAMSLCDAGYEVSKSHCGTQKKR